MKKSTLITTIAMIVVVVVALSTATYAWFSSATATAVTANITTEAGSGWLLMGGAYNSSGNTVTYSSTTALNLTFMNGLFSPEEALDTALASKNASTTINNRDAFYTATFESGEARSDAGIELKTPNMIRVVNADTSSRELCLRIIVYVDAAEDNAFKAANAFSTYISAYGASQYVAYTKYGFGDLSDTTEGEGAGYYVATQGAGASNSVAANGTPKVIAANYLAGYNPTEAVPNNGWKQLNAQTTIGTSTTINADTWYYTIEFTFETVESNNAVNFVFYTWLDGWALDDTARNATVNLVYEFGRTQDLTTLKPKA